MMINVIPTASKLFHIVSPLRLFHIMFLFTMNMFTLYDANVIPTASKLFYIVSPLRLFHIMFLLNVIPTDCKLFQIVSDCFTSCFCLTLYDTKCDSYSQ